MTFIEIMKETGETRIPGEKSQEQGPRENRSQKAPAKIYFLKMGVILKSISNIPSL